VLHTVIRTLSAKDAGIIDQRDKEIYRFGEYVGQSFLVIGGVAALVVAMAEVDHFWIANALYLAFPLRDPGFRGEDRGLPPGLSAVVCSTAKTELVRSIGADHGGVRLFV
jgi:hypothetical protein